MRFFALPFLLLASTLAMAAPVQFNGARIMEVADGTQLVFDLSGKVEYSSFQLDNPPRLVVDFKNARSRNRNEDLRLRSPDVLAMRAGIRHGVDLRIVVDLAMPMRQTIHLNSSPNSRWKLIVDLYRHSPATASSVAAIPATVVPVRGRPHAPAIHPVKDLVIAIDPGHGGKDSGAIGPSGIQEKEVVLDVARHLQRLIDKEPHMRAVLTRDDDHYLRLYERIEIARKHKADLFISVHADAFDDADARGSSVFILSTKGASSAAARWLANKENAADLIGGGSLVNVDDELKPVVLDMVHDAVLADSMRFGEKVLGNLDDVGKLHKGHVERAGFAVLKAPDIPSILVETAFISNPREEANLRSPRHQQRIAQALMKGIRAYFRNRPSQVDYRMAAAVPEPQPEGLQPEARNPPSPTVYVTQRGDTLAGIARRYQIDLPRLLSTNGLRSNQVRLPAGTPLTIPGNDS